MGKESTSTTIEETVRDPRTGGLTKDPGDLLADPKPQPAPAPTDQDKEATS